MTPEELAREKRKQQRLKRLGTNTPRCPGCGETDDRCFEAHHVAGRRHDPATVPMCANCHRKATDDQQDHPELNREGDAFLEQIGHFLLGLADLFRLVVEKLAAFGEALIERARAGRETRPEARP